MTRGRPSQIPSAILHVLLGAEPRRRDEISEIAGPSSSALSGWLRPSSALMQSAFVRRHDDRSYSLGPGLGHVLAFDFGRDDLTASLVGPDGRAHHLRKVPHGGEPSLKELFARLRETAAIVLAEGLQDPELVHEGALWLLGAAAAYSFEDRWLRRAVSEADDVALVLASALGLPVHRCVASERAVAAALADGFSFATPEAGGVALSVQVGTGVDAVALLGGRSDPDRHPFIELEVVGAKRRRDLGHLPVDQGLTAEINRRAHVGLRPLDYSRPCTCGRYGHVNSMLGLDGVVARLGWDPLPDHEMAQRLQEAQPGSAAAAALDDSGLALGHVLSPIVAALGPTSVILSGEQMSEPMSRSFQGAVYSNLLYGSDYAAVIRYGNVDVQRVTGAALLLLREVLYRGFFDHLTIRRSEAEGASAEWSGWPKGMHPLAVTGAEAFLGDAVDVGPIESFRTMRTRGLIR